MGRVILCLGEYAKKPYFLERAYINVYSVEELCYCIMKNTYLIGKEIVDDRLTDWLEEECGLNELAEKLRQVMDTDGSVGGYVGTILDYVGYGSREEIEKAKEGLEKEAGLSVYEKRLARADHLAENKKYMSALKCYDNLLEELPETERALKAKVFHNCGTAYAGLYQFKNAADSFGQAFEWGKREESYISFLAASRMYMEETDYLDFIARQPQAYEQSLKAEKRLEEAMGEFEGTQESRMLFTLKVCKEENNTVSYYEEVERIIDDLKEQYRQMVEK